jgi:ComF family protein
MSTRFGVITAAANAITATLLAPACAVCDAVLDTPLDGCVCRICWASVKQTTPPVCDSCGEPLATERRFCTLCADHPRVIRRARAVGGYEGTLRELVHALKYQRRQSLARPLARMMRERGRELLSTADAVVPVPLHWRREYTRGFNQSRELARHLGPPVQEMIVRTRNTRAQIELAAGSRHSNVQGAFSVRRNWLGQRSDVRRKLLLIDDVSTTGATLEACAIALLEAGAIEVCALTAARVMTRVR